MNGGRHSAGESRALRRAGYLVEFIERVKREPNSALSHAALLELWKSLASRGHVLRPLWRTGGNRQGVLLSGSGVRHACWDERPRRHNRV